MDVEARVGGHLERGEIDQAASAAIEGYGPSVYGYVCSMLEEDDARDVYSQWEEDLWRGLPGFRGECTLRAWAFRLARHAAARHRRDPWRARGERLPSSAASRLAAPALASSVLPGGRREVLRNLRAGLEPDDQTLLVLRVDRELEWDEIAAVLSTEEEPVSAAALRKRYERLKARLAERLREAGLLE